MTRDDGRSWPAVVPAATTAAAANARPDPDSASTAPAAAAGRTASGLAQAPA